MVIRMEAVRIEGGGRVLRHVREADAGIRGEDQRAAVRNARGLAVLIRTADIHEVWIARRCVDQVVVPALACAVVEGSKARLRRVRAGEVDERRHPGCHVVAAEQAAVAGKRLAADNHRASCRSLADIHPGLAIRQRRHRDLRPHRAVEGKQRRFDLHPGGSAVGRAPDAARVRSCVDDGGIHGIEDDPAYALAGTGGCDDRKALGRRRRAVVQERPGRAAVAGLPQTLRLRAGDRRRRAADRRHAADAARRRDVDDGRVGRVNGDRTGSAPAEVRCAKRTGPRVAAVGRPVHADARCGVTGPVCFPGPDPEGLSRRVVGIEHDGPDRVDADAAREVFPSRAS